MSAGNSPKNPLHFPSTGADAKRAPALAARLRRLWPEATGDRRPMTEGALYIALGYAWSRSGLAEVGGGGWWRGEMAGSGNLGAVPADGEESFAASVDYSVPGAAPVRLRFYRAGNIGGAERSAEDVAAFDFLRTITQWPALDELRAGDVLGYAAKQGDFGTTIGERVANGRAIASHLPAVAAALGHERIHARIAPELIFGEDSPRAVSGPCCGEAEEPGDVSGCCATPEVSYPEEDMDVLEGVGVTVAVAFASAIAAALVGAIAADALKTHSEKKASEVIEAIRKVGIDYLDPGAKPRDGWKVLQSNDPQLLRALEFLGSKRDSVLRNLAGKGFRFQARVRLKIPAAMVKAAQRKTPGAAAPTNAEIERLRAEISARFKSYTPAQVDQAVKDHLAATGPAAAQAEANWTPAAQAALEACMKKGGDLLSCSQDKAVIAATKAPANKIPELAQDREPIRRPENIEYTTATEEEAQRRTFQGANSTAVEGAGTVVAVTAAVIAALFVTGSVAAGVLKSQAEAKATEVIGGLRAAGLDYVEPGSEPKPGWIEIDPSGPQVQKALSFLGDKAGVFVRHLVGNGYRFQAKKSESASAKAAAVSGEADVTPEAAAASDAHAVAVLPIEGAATAAAVVAGGLAAGVLAAVALTRTKEAAPAPVVAPAATIAPAPAGPAVTRPKAPDASPAAPKPVGVDRGKVAATKAAQSAVQKAESEMSALYARGDATESEIQEKLEDIEKLKAKTTAAKYGIPLYGAESVGESVNALWLAGALPRARAIPGSGGALVWYLETPPSLGAAKKTQKDEDEPDDVDKALATSSDITDIAESALKAFSSAKKIAQRGATIEDPKCRKLIKKWVEKHPILARFTTPDLRTLEGGISIPLFADRYADSLSTMRAASGFSGESCEPTKAEHLAVMADLGLSRQEEDAIYTATSRTAATALDLYAPGAGQSAQQAADVISSLITGRKMAPGPATPARAPARGEAPDALKKAQAEAKKAKTEKANVVKKVKEFVSNHPIITKFFSPDLTTISGARRTR